MVLHFPQWAPRLPSIEPPFSPFLVVKHTKTPANLLLDACLRKSNLVKLHATARQLRLLSSRRVRRTDYKAWPNAIGPETPPSLTRETGYLVPSCPSNSSPSGHAVRTARTLLALGHTMLHVAEVKILNAKICSDDTPREVAQPIVSIAPKCSP
jgi:hypothetical protein